MPFGKPSERNKKVATLPRRDRVGNILPMRVPMFDGSGDIIMKPLTEGRFNEIDYMIETERPINFHKVLIEECLVEPVINWSEFKIMKPEFKSSLVKTLMFENGIDVGDDKKKIHVPNELKSEQRKNYEKFRLDEFYTKKIALLTGFGINHLNIINLTKREIMFLIEVANPRKQTPTPEKGGVHRYG